MEEELVYHWLSVGDQRHCALHVLEAPDVVGHDLP